MAIPKFKPLEEASGSTKKIVKPVLIAVIAILLGAFGLEASSNDFDLGKLFGGSSLQESKVARDEEGNVLFDKEGQMLHKARVPTNITVMTSPPNPKPKDFSLKSVEQIMI